MFVADRDGKVHEFKPDGTLVQSKETGTYDLLDINMDEDGNLLIGSRSGKIIMTDTSLESMATLADLGDSNGDDNVYVAFVDTPAAVPEPASAALLATAAAGVGASAAAGDPGPRPRRDGAQGRRPAGPIHHHPAPPSPHDASEGFASGP